MEKKEHLRFSLLSKASFVSSLCGVLFSILEKENTDSISQKPFSAKKENFTLAKKFLRIKKL